MQMCDTNQQMYGSVGSLPPKEYMDRLYEIYYGTPQAPFYQQPNFMQITDEDWQCAQQQQQQQQGQALVSEAPVMDTKIEIKGEINGGRNTNYQGYYN